MAKKKAVGSSLPGEVLDSPKMESDHLGEGGFGIVKMVQTKEGENFAVKIEAREARGEQNAELKVMKVLKYFKGEAVRKTQGIFKKQKITQKLYTVTKLRKGEELFKSLYYPDLAK